MKTHSVTLQIPTKGKGTYKITAPVEEELKRSGIQNGTVTLFVQHTSCSLIIMENADPTARQDLETFFAALVPEDIPYFTHTYEGPDDMPSHIRMVLTGCSEIIPIINGAMALGTWQGLYLFEHRHSPHDRRVVMMAMGL